MIEDYTTVEEYIHEGREELKRVEHIIYVSLKYTRTTDVLRGALLRFVSFFDMVVHAYMIKAEETEDISRIPRSPALKAKKLAELNSEDKDMQRFIHYYFFLKELLKNDYEKINEYRRHVGMIFDFEDNSVAVNIDSLETCEHFAHKFYHYSNRRLGLVEEGEYQ